MATTDGYTYCTCRDCFELTISNDIRNPEMCADCTEAQCELNAECRRVPDDLETLEAT